MAVVKGPALSIMASGNLGAICYSRWRELAIARDVWTGTVPNTSKQVLYQADLVTMAQAWGATLTEVEREAWRAEARVATFQNRFGEPVHYSGYVLFVSRNMNRKRWSQTVLLKPIAGSGYMIWWSKYMVWNVPNKQLIFRAWNHPTGKYPHCLEAWYAGPFDSPGRRAQDPEYRFVGYDDTPTFYIVKGPMPQSKWYWLKMRFGDLDGTVSPFLYQQVFGTP